MPSRQRSEKKGFRIFTAVGAFAAAIAVVFLLAYLLPQLKIESLKKENNEISASLSAIGDFDEAVKNYEKKQAKLKQIKGTYDEINKEKTDVLGFLDNLKKYIPENVYISSFTYNSNGSININFTTFDPVDIAKLVVKLRQMDMFESVELSSVPLEKAENSISLSLKLKKEGVKK